MSHNSILAKRASMPDEIKQRVKDINDEIDELIESSYKFNDVEEDGKILELLKELEFELQEYWGFEKNEAYHRSWYKVSTCKCPRLDNKDRYATGTGVINSNCPHHGTNNV